MKTPNEQLLELYYRRIQSMEFKIKQLQIQLNINNERKNNTYNS